MKFGKCGLLIATVTLLAVTAATLARANALGNASFEEPIASAAPGAGFWTSFSSDSAAVATTADYAPRSGAQHLLLQISNSPNSFAGVLQDVPNLAPGEEVSLEGWHRTPSDPLDVGVEIRIEWRNSVQDIEVSRTTNLTTPPTGEYQQFVVTATVPNGADTARIVYAIQTFSSSPTNDGAVYVDDLSFPSSDEVPVETTSWGQLISRYR